MDLIGLGSSLTAFVLFYNTLDAGFVYDDRRAILNNQDVLPTTPLINTWLDDFWGTPLTSSGTHGSYRPLCVLSFRLNYILAGGFRPFGYHLVNVLLHSLATSLVVKLARILFTNSLPVAIAGLLFASHPIHTEAVAGVVGRADIGACVFYLTSFISYLNHVKYRHKLQCSKKSFCKIFQSPRDVIVNHDLDDYKSSSSSSCGYLWIQCCGWMLLCLVSSACAMLTKETGLTVLLVCGVYDLIVNGKCLTQLLYKKKHRAQLASLCVLGLTFCLLLMTRLLLMGAQPPMFASSDNPSSRCPQILTRTLTFLYLPAFNFILLILPKWLSYDWSMDSIPRITTIIDPRNIVSMLFYYFLYKTIRICLNRLMHRVNPTPIPSTQLKRLQRILNRQQIVQQQHKSCPVCHNTMLDQHNTYCTTNNNNNSLSSYINLSKFNTTNISCVLKQSNYYDKGINIYKNGYYKSKTSETSQCYCNKCLTPETYNNSYKYINMYNIKNDYVKDNTTKYNQVKLSKCAYTNSSSIKEKYTSAQITLIALSFLIIPFLPATNLLFYVGFVVAERILYIPSVGYCFLISIGFNYVIRIVNKKAVLYAAGIMLCALCIRTVVRNKDWHDEEILYRSGISINPPKSYGNLGTILNAHGRTNEAEEAYKTALKYRPNMADVHYNLGVLEQAKQKYDEAIQSYQLAIQYRPSLALAHLNLGQLLASLGRCEEAVVVLRRCSQLDGSGLKDPKTHEATRISALIHLGRLYADQQRYNKAVSVYMEAVKGMPSHYQPQVLYNLLGDAYSQLKNTEEAEKWYKAALQAKPDHVPAHLTYGKLLAKNRTRVTEAEQWFLKAKKLAPSEPAVYQHFGQFLAELERHSEAAAHYVRAAELAPHEYEAMLNAATALRQADQKVEAEKYYRQAVKLRPEDARSHSNLGAMLHLNGKYKEAAQSYRTALKLQPNDVTTLANLHKLKSLMNKLET